MGLFDKINKDLIGNALNECLGGLTSMLQSKDPIAHGLEYLKNLPDNEVQGAYDLMLSYNEDQRSPELLAFAEKRLDEIKNKKTDVQEESQTPLKSVSKSVSVEKGEGISRLDSLKITPRNIETGLACEAVGKPPLFGKAKWKERMETALFFYGYVVQANSALWEEGDDVYLPAVFVASDDPKYACDIAFLSQMADKISEMQESTNVPEDCKEFIDTLRDSESGFTFKVGESVTGGASVWCFTYKIEEQKYLPGSKLPENHVVPFFLEKPFEYNRFTEVRMVNGKLYS